MSLGDELRDAREKAGLSVDDIMHVTKMTRDQVAGLETANYRAFSAPVYTKGFIKQYARAVGLDPAPLVAEYLANPNGTEKNDPAHEMPIVALETISAESGALVSLRPKVPHAAPAPEPAPAEKKVVAAAPAPEKPVAAAPAPAPAEQEKTLLDFMAPPAEAAAPAPVPAPKPAPAPLPEKRLAPIAPGIVPPEPVSKLVRFDDPAPKPAPAPIEKPLPEPSAVGSAAAYWNEVAPPVAPKPIASAVAPFVFPGAAVAPKPAPVPAPAPQPVFAPAPVPRPAPAPAPAPRPAPAAIPEKKVSAERDPLVAAAARPPVLSSAAAPSFVEDDLFGTPERTPPPPAEPAKPAPPAGPTLFPDDELAAAPDAPNAAKILFANLGASLRRFGGSLRRLGGPLRRLGVRIRGCFQARWVRPALLGVVGVAILAALVGLLASLLPAGGTTDPATDIDRPAPAPVAGPSAGPAAPRVEIPEGPIEIVPVLPAPRSFAK